MFHKFFVLNHIFNTLQINPNKKIILYVKDGLYKFPTDFKKRYPNIEIKSTKIIADWIDKSNISLDYFEQFKELVNMDNYDLYMDDMSIFMSIGTMIRNNSLINIDWNILLNNYLSFLYKANSVNIISDGTLSYAYYSNLFYKLFLLLDCRVENNEFVNATRHITTLNKWSTQNNQ